MSWPHEGTGQGAGTHHNQGRDHRSARDVGDPEEPARPAPSSAPASLRSPTPTRPSTRRTALRATTRGVSGQGHPRAAAVGRVAVVGLALAHPRFTALARSIRRYRDLIWNTLDHGLFNADPRPPTPPAGIDQARLWIPQPGRTDSHGHAHPRRPLPSTTRTEMTHYNVKIR